MFGLIIGAIVGAFAAPSSLTILGLSGAAAGALLGAGAGYSFYDQPRMAKAEASKSREAATAAQEKAIKAQQDLAGYGYLLTKEQMEKQMKQRELQSLTDVILAQDRQPRILTLPTAEPTSPAERINRVIDDFLKGVA